MKGRIFVTLSITLLCADAFAYDAKDVAVAKKASQLVWSEYEKGGISRLRYKVDDCYKKLKADSKVESYLSCFAFHYTAYKIDKRASEVLHFAPSINGEEVLSKINQYLPNRIKSPKDVNRLVSDWLDLMK